MKRYSKGLFLTVCGLALCLLAGCKEKLPDPPERYEIEGDSVFSLDSIMAEGQGTLTSVQTPGEGEEGAGQQIAYHYDEMEDPLSLVRTYSDSLINDEGFIVTDQDNRELLEPPALEEGDPTLVLERPSQTEGYIFQVAMGWSENGCSVQVARLEGEIQMAMPAGAGDVEEIEPTVLTDQLAYLYSLPPSRFGLEGESMEEYTIYPVEGLAVIDGVTCRRFNIYLRRPENTNGILGTYFLSPDRQSLYRLNPESDSVDPI